MVMDYLFLMQNFKEGKSILFSMTFIALLTLPVVFSPSVTAVTTSASAGTTTSTEQLTNTQAEFIGEVDVSALPAPIESIGSPLSLPQFSPSTKAHVGRTATAGVGVGSGCPREVFHYVDE